MHTGLILFLRDTVSMPRPQRLLFVITGSIAAGAVILYSSVIWSRSAAIGMTAVETLGRLSTYFTILTNILLGAGCLIPAFAPDSAAGRFFRRPGVRTALLLYIGTVGAVSSQRRHPDTVHPGALRAMLRRQCRCVQKHSVTPHP